MFSFDRGVAASVALTPSQERQRVTVEAVPIFGQPPAAVKPRDGALHDTQLGQHDGLATVAPPYVLDVHRAAYPGQALLELRSLIARVGIELQQKRIHPKQKSPPDEVETINAMNATFDKILETTAKDYGHAVRSVHAKAHGILEGTLAVHPDLPPELAQGMFKTPGEHNVYIRLSTNSGVSDYLAPDLQAGGNVYAVLMEATKNTGRVSISRVVKGQGSARLPVSDQ